MGIFSQVRVLENQLKNNVFLIGHGMFLHNFVT